MIEIARIKEIFNSKDIDLTKIDLHNAISKRWQELTPNWHPLGFIHTKLAEDTDETYRLHIWPVNLTAIKPQEHKIHDHLFDVDSVVLAGAVENIEYDVLPSSQLADTHRVLRVEYLRQGPRIYEDETSCSLTSGSSKIISYAERYKIKRHILHETSRVSDGTAVTFVKTSKSSDYRPRIIVPIGAPLPAMRPQIKFPMSDWLALVGKFLVG